MPEVEPFKSVKTKLTNILQSDRAEETLSHIEDAVRRTNDIVRHAYQLLKLFLIHNSTHPVDDKLVKYCLQSCYSAKKGSRKGKAEDEALKIRVKQFRIREYEPLLAEHQRLPDGSRLGQIIKLQEADMIQNLETIASLHYTNHLWRFLKFTFRLREYEASVDETDGLSLEEKKKKKSDKKKQILAIKRDILNLTDEPLTSDAPYHSRVQELRPSLRPLKNVTQFAKRSIPYDVKSNPLDYIPCLLFMTKEMEKDAKQRNVNVRLFHPLPLRASLVPCHITIDTEALQNLIPKIRKKGSIQDVADELWGDRFTTENRVFRKGSKTDPRYIFRNMISTDGVAATILLVKTHLKGRRMIKTAKQKNEDVYIDDQDALKGFDGRRVVAIDPGKSDLIYCNDGRTTFRYTQNNRRKDLKVKKSREIRKALETQELREAVESLNQLNTKTCDNKAFKTVIRQKNEHAHRFTSHYSQFMYRKLKLNGYINRQRSESLMLKGFERAFGEKNTVWIAFGDHEQRGLQMRGIEPTIDTGLRTLFRRNKFCIRLIDEHKTSCRCHLCGRPNETFLSILNPKPWKRRERKTCHGLLRCQTPNQTTGSGTTRTHCRGVSGWNRDKVATENMLLIARGHLKGEDRPIHLCRTNRQA